MHHRVRPAAEALSRHGEDDITLVLARLGRP